VVLTIIKILTLKKCDFIHENYGTSSKKNRLIRKRKKGGANSMKRIYWMAGFFIVIFILFAGATFAQMGGDQKSLKRPTSKVDGTVYTQMAYDPELLKKIGLKQNQINKIMNIMEQTARIKREAQIELNLRKAQLEKLLFPIDVDIEAVKKVLRESLEWKYKADLAEIKARVEIRKIMGEEKWNRYLRELRLRRRGDRFKEPKPKKPAL